MIDAGGANRGVLAIDDAMRFARESSLDLVELSPDTDPPVCRVMDYGKYRFTREKKNQGSRKKQKRMQLKEIKLRPGIEEGDYQTKLRSVLRFLGGGDKVKVTLRFRGREMAYSEIGKEVLERVTRDIGSHADVEKPTEAEGRTMVIVFVPKKRQNSGNEHA